MGTRALPGKPSGTAGFPSICTVTRARFGRMRGGAVRVSVYLNLGAQVCRYACDSV